MKKIKLFVIFFWFNNYKWARKFVGGKWFSLRRTDELFWIPYEGLLELSLRWDVIVNNDFIVSEDYEVMEVFK